MKRYLTCGALASPSQVAPIRSTTYRQTLEALMIRKMKINERGVFA
ncbi:hypothetical protein BLA39750_01194 [Burkholderia lata]|uniref:Uncharacterized protein n=1 Tax=Burkholderia lata (strain ATCC 17760 / DSM 23089 / LMG 22485 / NCIMB 9086 / R18194 / 383) TaxID=482957 RepID=A0A6P2VB22_BURL3|nr:hypothetical protein BLA39750_01194 [Burkholderia lata]